MNALLFTLCSSCCFDQLLTSTNPLQKQNTLILVRIMAFAYMQTLGLDLDLDLDQTVDREDDAESDIEVEPVIEGGEHFIVFSAGFPFDIWVSL